MDTVELCAPSLIKVHRLVEQLVHIFWFDVFFHLIYILRLSLGFHPIVHSSVLCSTHRCDVCCFKYRRQARK